MIKNYLKVVFNDIRKNPAFSTINILGLSISLTTSLLIIIYVSFEMGYDRFHEKAERIYRLRMDITTGEVHSQNASTYPVLRNLIVTQFPEANSAVRVFPKSGVLALDENSDIKFSEGKIFYADDDFFKVFSFHLIEGDPSSCLSQPNSIVFTESMVKKYFEVGTNYKDIIGKYVRKIGTTENELLVITGISQDAPQNSHLLFDFIVSYKSIHGWTDQDGEDYKTLAENSTEWPGFYTYILLEQEMNKDNLAAFEEQISKTFASNIPEYQSRNSYSFQLQPLVSIHFGDKLRGELNVNGDRRNIITLGIVSFFLLIIAVVNYVNLSSAKTSERFKEVGVRKVLGATRGQIILRFILESMFFSLISTLLAILMFLIFWYWLRHYFNIEFEYPFWYDKTLYLFIGLTFILNTLIYSLYPIMILSKQYPIMALRGEVFGIKGGELRKALVVFQFFIATGLIAGSLVIYRQMMFMKSAETGVSTENKLVLRVPKIPTDRQDYLRKSEVFKTQIGTLSFVDGVTMGVRIPGEEMATQIVGLENQAGSNSMLMSILGVDHDYLKTLKLKVLVGKDFSLTNQPDQELIEYNESRINFGTNDHSVIINESAAKLLGFKEFEEALGEKITLFGTKKVIIGVVSDYYHRTVKEVVQPTVFYIQLVYASYYVISLNDSNSIQENINSIQSLWKQHYPSYPFEFFFLDEFYNRTYKTELQFQRVFAAFTSLVVVISCLGLFALSLFTISKRAKEITIRKVVGASYMDILRTILRNFLILISISLIIATPVVYYIFSNWLERYPYRIAIDIWMILIPAILIVFMTIAIVSFQTIIFFKRISINNLRSD
jgi:putative ABC transport system permease protein